jgi:hypothetical protein
MRISGNLEAAFTETLVHYEFVLKVHSLKEGFQLMISIGTHTENPEKKVYLRRATDPQAFHKGDPPSDLAARPE